MLPKMMKAAVIDKFGDRRFSMSARFPCRNRVKTRSCSAFTRPGSGPGDPWLREERRERRRFPQVLGSDGARTVVARGSKARRFKVGDRVYAYAYDNQKGGFYAEYAAVSEDDAARIPANLGTLEAGALPASGVTALLGLEKLKIGKAEALMILGASGGVGHVALQLANRMGALRWPCRPTRTAST